MRILITGGAGFVGSALARAFAQVDGNEVITFDSLHRRGSELNLPGFRERGIGFVHGDVRQRQDLFDLVGNFDLFIDASAEPSVLSGQGGSPTYVLDTNLNATSHCLEFARERAGLIVFLSTSRVYSIQPLQELALTEDASRFELADEQCLRGASGAGVAEDFPTGLPRSFYGATKLASEMLIQEYSYSFGLQAVINRCGVIAGPGQFGKVDQGVFSLWVMHHHFGLPLRYTGFGGCGKQVRDLLHPLDLFALIQLQVESADRATCEIFNVGGGREISTSLLEWTALCEEATGRGVEIGSQPESAPVDVPLYLSDTRKVQRSFGWRPERSAAAIVADTASWIQENEQALRLLLP